MYFDSATAIADSNFAELTCSIIATAADSCARNCSVNGGSISQTCRQDSDFWLTGTSVGTDCAAFQPEVVG